MLRVASAAVNVAMGAISVDEPVAVSEPAPNALPAATSCMTEPVWPTLVTEYAGRRREVGVRHVGGHVAADDECACRGHAAGVIAVRRRGEAAGGRPPEHDRRLLAGGMVTVVVRSGVPAHEVPLSPMTVKSCVPTVRGAGVLACSVSSVAKPGAVDAHRLREGVAGGVAVAR